MDAISLPKMKKQTSAHVFKMGLPPCCMPSKSETNVILSELLCLETVSNILLFCLSLSLLTLAVICLRILYSGISEAEYTTVLPDEIKAIKEAASDAMVHQIAMVVVQKRHPYRLVYEAKIAIPSQSEKALTYLNPVPGNNMLQ